eukprot:scaffold285748_cov28-Tisochrysis_lutea.AAC.1
MPNYPSAYLALAPQCAAAERALRPGLPHLLFMPVARDRRLFSLPRPSSLLLMFIQLAAGKDPPAPPLHPHLHSYQHLLRVVCFRSLVVSRLCSCPLCDPGRQPRSIRHPAALPRALVSPPM